MIEVDPAGDTTNNLEALRAGQMDAKDIVKLQNKLQDDSKAIDRPEKSELFDKKVTIPEGVSGNVQVNGRWVHPLYAKLNNMMYRGYSPVVCVVGKEGKGKSITANVLLWYLHNKLNILSGEFKAIGQLVYKPIEFLLLIRNATRTGIMFDEANETVNKNTYNSKMNTSVVGAIRTQRKRENLYLFVGPELGELDPRIQNKVDMVIELTGKAFAKVRTYETNHGRRSGSGKQNYTWQDYPNWDVPELPQELVDAYDTVDDEYKGEYLDQLLLNVLEERLENIQNSITMGL